MELALSLGKKVELIVEGEFTQLNKDILSKLYDPLIHMLRNSIDHGIASPEARLKAGKKKSAQFAFQLTRTAAGFISLSKTMDKVSIQAKLSKKLLNKKSTLKKN